MCVRERQSKQTTNKNKNKEQEQEQEAEEEEEEAGDGEWRRGQRDEDVAIEHALIATYIRIEHALITTSTNVTTLCTCERSFALGLASY